MEVPHEIFESAIDKAARRGPDGKATATSLLLDKTSVITFPKSKFLQLLVNSVQDVVERTTVKDRAAHFERWNAA